MFLRKSILPALHLLVLFLTLGLTSVTVHAESTWDQIKRTGVLRAGAIQNPPFWFTDPATGEWKGAMVEMAQDIANTLGVKLVNVETTWGTAVLDLQSNKTDLQFSLQATPTRALAIDFAGPAYNVLYYAINSQKFHGGTWADYNKPNVKIAGMTGTSDMVMINKMTPQAQHVSLPTVSDASMAVTSGHVDAMITTAIVALAAKAKNPGLGSIVLLTPQVSLPSYIGIRREPDQSFHSFLQAWAEWNELLGYNDERLRRNLSTLGVTDIPDDVHF